MDRIADEHCADSPRCACAFDPVADHRPLTMYHPHKAIKTTGTNPPKAPPITSAFALLKIAPNRGPICPPRTQPPTPLTTQEARLRIGVENSSAGFRPRMAGAMPTANNPPIAPTATPA